MTLNKYYKEKDYAEEMLNKRVFDARNASDLKILAKYYRHQQQVEGLKLDIKESLTAFCNKKAKGWFNEVLNYKMIDGAISFISKEENKLVQIDSVPITKSELDFIEKLEYSKIEKKILFSFLVINKLKHEKNKLRGIEVNCNMNYFGGSGSYSYKTLLETLQEKLTRTFKEKEIHKIIKKFNDDGLTRTTQKTALELLFIKDIKNNEEVILEVLDFDTIGLYYDYYIGDEKVRKCIDCELYLVATTSSTKIRCISCSEERRILQNKEKALKYYHKNKTLPNEQ